MVAPASLQRAAALRYQDVLEEAARERLIAQALAAKRTNGRQMCITAARSPQTARSRAWYALLAVLPWLKSVS